MYKFRRIGNFIIIFGWLVTTAFQPLPASFAPAAPADFGKIAPSFGNLYVPNVGTSLQWNPSTLGVTYQYCLRPNRSGCQDKKWIDAGTATSVPLQGLTPGLTYYWQVRATDATGTTYADSGAWWWFTVQINANLPGSFGKIAPEDASLGVDVNGLLLSWGSSSGATRYDYCFDTVNNNQCDATWVDAGDVLSTPLPSLVYNTLYYWQVRAVNTSGSVQADSGTWWTFWTRTAPPGAFSKLTPADGTTGQPDSFTLTWQATAGATYEYCLDQTHGSTCAISGPWTSTGSNTSASISGLSYATTYYWQVRATNGGTVTLANEGIYWSFSTRIAPPGSFGKSSPGNDALDQPLNPTLSWGTSAGTNVTYEYCYSLNDIVNNICDGTWYLAGTTTTATPSGLSNNKLYYWQVRAVNTSGETYANGGTPWHFTTQISKPWPFNKINPYDGTTGVPLNVTLEWSPSEGVDQYWYCVDEETVNNNTCDSSWRLNDANTTAQPAFLTTGKTYWWQVKAVNNQGETPAQGDWWTFSTIASAPETFSKISPMDGAVDQPLSPWLFWSQSLGAQSYEYCIIATVTPPTACDTDWTVVTPNPAPDELYPSILITGPLAYNTSYYWQIRAINGGTTEANLGVWSSFVTLKTPPVVDDQANQALQTNEDTPLTAALAATSNYGKTFALVGSLPAGTLDFHSDGGFTYTPMANYDGPVSFQFVVSDGYNPPTAPHTATITVNPVNDPPVLAAIPDQVVQTATQVTFTAVATDADLPYGDSLTYSILEGLPAGASFDSATGFFSWIPKWSTFPPGEFSFTVMVTDNGVPLPALTAQQVVHITVTPVMIWLPIIHR